MVNPASNPARERRTDTRERLEQEILDAAKRLFAQRGYGGVSLDHIARKAGTAKQNLLYYFASKEGLYRRVLNAVLDVWLSYMAAIADYADDPETALRKYIPGKLRFSREHPHDSRVYANEVIAGAPLFAREIKDRVLPALQADIAIFNRWADLGICRRVLRRCRGSAGVHGIANAACTRWSSALTFGTIRSRRNLERRIAMKIWLSILGLAASSLIFPEANAQAWPSASVTLVVGFAPGGSTDIAARVISQHLSIRLGQPVLVVNRPGASGVIGAASVASAKPDGQTFLFGSGSLAAGPSLMKSLPYDPSVDFVPISQLTVISSILALHPSVPARTTREFVDYVKANPGKVNYGSAGSGSLQHVAGALFEKSIGGQMTHIAYKGGAPANADLVAGRIQAVFGPIVELMPFVKAGSIRALGVTTGKRSAVLPEAAPISDDVPGFDIGTWHGLLAPKGTDPTIVEGMNRAIAAVLKEPAVRTRLIELGLEPVGNSPQEFAGYFQSEIRRWRELVQISGAQPE